MLRGLGLMAAIGVIAAGEMVKYATLWALSHKEHLRFGRDDLVLTLIFGASALGVREILWLSGWSVGEHAIHLRSLLGIVGL